jgi:hypothetical protein
MGCRYLAETLIRLLLQWVRERLDQLGWMTGREPGNCDFSPAQSGNGLALATCQLMELSYTFLSVVA